MATAYRLDGLKENFVFSLGPKTVLVPIHFLERFTWGKAVGA
jgi:hypothetical protein